MQREADSIDEPQTALLWTLGCIAASYSERMVMTDIFRSTPTRLILALLIAFMAFSELIAPIIVLHLEKRRSVSEDFSIRIAIHDNDGGTSFDPTIITRN
jgi:hypothetical protein